MDEVVRIDGRSLTIEQVVSVARYKAEVAIPREEVYPKVKKCSDWVEKAATDKRIIYGVTTGFGESAHVVIEDPSEAIILQKNLIRSHSVGVGKPLPKPVVRAAMLLRTNTLAKGYSGIRYETLETLEKMINREVCPVIPEKGSVGGSGDLAPLSHMVLAMMGKGEAYYGDAEDPIKASDAIKLAGIKPIELSYKEGLALNNGTPIMTAIATLVIHDAEQLVKVADIATAMTLEALAGLTDAFDEKIHIVRPHDGQIRSAKNIRNLINGSKLAFSCYRKIGLRSVLENAGKIDDGRARAGIMLKFDSKELLKKGISICELTRKFEGLENDKTFKEKFGEIIVSHDTDAKTITLQIRRGSSETLLDEILGMEFNKNELAINQDAYSLRCAPQVNGAVRDTIKFAREIIETEINSANDNPLIFVEENEALSGGNFHGQPIAVAMDAISAALTTLGDISERRVFRILDRKLNRGLPAFLIEKSGLNSGFMMTQYTAASLVEESRTLSYPAGIGSIPTCANAEDHVSMGTISARKAMEISNNVQYIFAIELLCAAQAIDFRVSKQFSTVEETLGLGTRIAYRRIRDNGIEYLKTDEILYPLIEKVFQLIEIGELPKAVSNVIKLE